MSTQHAFREGDRVKQLSPFPGYGTYVRCHSGSTGNHGHLIARDDRRTGCHHPDWWVKDGKLTHDRDLQVGDWVRYVEVDSFALREEGEIGRIEFINVEGDTARVSWRKVGRYSWHNTGHLVKIQPPVLYNCFYSGVPPKEEKTTCIKIKHRINGAIISGVTESPNPCEGWAHVSPDGSSRVVYYRGHWEPVEEWVTIQVNRQDWDKSDKGCGEFITMSRDNGARVRWRTTQ